MLLEIKDISCGYKKTMVIEDVSFHISEGEVLCLFGPNGVGKTTFFKTLLGLMKPLSGEILLKKQKMCHMDRLAIAKNMAYVPQAHHMAFSFKVIDVVVLGRIAYSNNSKGPTDADYEKAWASLRLLNIQKLGERLYTKISGGERQMVLIARALTQEASILVMDEPTSNLDYGNQIKVMEQIKRLKQLGYAVILTTHSPEQVLLCGDHVIIFHNGRIYKTGKPKDIITSNLFKELYDVEVSVHESNKDGLINLCVPVL